MARPSLILCEGKSDEAFFEELLKVRAISNLEIKKLADKEHGGWSGFGTRLKALKIPAETRERKAIIIIADNDDNPQESFRRIQEQIRLAGDYDVPSAPCTLSNVGDYPSVYVLMLPWNEVAGCLESICVTSARSKRPNIAECVDAFVQCANAKDWSLTKRSKFELRCLMSAACEADPMVGLPYAWSTDSGKPGDLIPLDHSCFNQIATCLSALA